MMDPNIIKSLRFCSGNLDLKCGFNFTFAPFTIMVRVMVRVKYGSGVNRVVFGQTKLPNKFEMRPVMQIFCFTLLLLRKICPPAVGNNILYGGTWGGQPIWGESPHPSPPIVESPGVKCQNFC